MAYLKNEKLKDVLLHKGVLHEVNRTFFHPLGLALTLLYFEESERMELKLQYTENEEGFVHDVIDKEKINSFRNYSQEKFENRNDILGFTIQTKDVNGEIIKKEKSASEQRLDIIMKYFKMFVYLMQKEIFENHSEMDIDNTFMSEGEILYKVYNLLDSNKHITSANYLMFLNFYDVIEKEISSLNFEVNEDD